MLLTLLGVANGKIRDFETYQKRFRYFEILPKFSETHVFRGSIRHPYCYFVKLWCWSWVLITTGRFANVSVRQRPVRQRMKSIRQRLMSVRQRLYVSSPTSKILCEIDLKCIYKLPKEDNVTFDLRWIVWFGLKMFVSLSPISLSLPLSLPRHPRLYSCKHKPAVKPFY